MPHRAASLPKRAATNPRRAPRHKNRAAMAGCGTESARSRFCLPSPCLSVSVIDFNTEITKNTEIAREDFALLGAMTIGMKNNATAEPRRARRRMRRRSFRSVSSPRVLRRLRGSAVAFSFVAQLPLHRGDANLSFIAGLRGKTSAGTTPGFAQLHQPWRAR
jgi:hypothetical protein